MVENSLPGAPHPGMVFGLHTLDVPKRSITRRAVSASSKLPAGIFERRKEGTMHLTIEVRARPEKFQELYQTLQALLPTLRRENGCRESRIYRDVEDDEVFFL